MHIKCQYSDLVSRSGTNIHFFVQQCLKYTSNIFAYNSLASVHCTHARSSVLQLEVSKEVLHWVRSKSSSTLQSSMTTLRLTIKVESSLQWKMENRANYYVKLIMKFMMPWSLIAMWKVICCLNLPCQVFCQVDAYTSEIVCISNIYGSTYAIPPL